MDNLQIWLYVIVGLIYLLSRFFKKNTDQPTDFPDASNPENPARRFEVPTERPVTTSKPKTLTFEELLQEITQAKTRAPGEPPVQEPYVNYDEEVPVEEQDLEDVNYNYRKDKVVQDYDSGKSNAFLRTSLEDTLKLEDTEITFGKFKAFEDQEQNNPLERYVNDIYDADSLKKAVVLSEILKTKF